MSLPQGESKAYLGAGISDRRPEKYQEALCLDAFEATESGFYTVMLSLPNRESYLIYLYVE